MKNNKGFTLLETLIALALVAISFLGIYNLLNLSIDIADYSKNKKIIYITGFEAILKDKNYDIFSSEKIINQGKIIFEKESNPTIIPYIREIVLKIEYAEVKDSYIYYETDF